MRTLVIGVGGTGKSYLVERMKRTGLNAIDLDNGFAMIVNARGDEAEYDPEGGNKWWETHYYVLKVEKLKRLLKENETVCVFGDVGGEPGKGNGLLDVLGLFDRICYLNAPRRVIRKRLAARTNNQFGKNTEEAEGVIKRKVELDKIAKKMKFDFVDTTLPTQEIIRILAGPV